MPPGPVLRCAGVDEPVVAADPRPDGAFALSSGGDGAGGRTTPARAVAAAGGAASARVAVLAAEAAGADDEAIGVAPASLSASRWRSATPAPTRGARPSAAPAASRG